MLDERGALVLDGQCYDLALSHGGRFCYAELVHVGAAKAAPTPGGSAPARVSHSRHSRRKVC
ncbi:hypothetical protein WMF45_42965 [Sorangium sp. So ce448]|uniref:hypothetical protein n=1 Tax=Sorangium sp. So ce448 TaxID=3133314 RepID=UPI003F614B6D